MEKVLSFERIIFLLLVLWKSKVTSGKYCAACGQWRKKDRIVLAKAANNLGFPVRPKPHEIQADVAKDKENLLILDNGIIKLPNPEKLAVGWQSKLSNVPSTAGDKVIVYVDKQPSVSLDFVGDISFDSAVRYYHKKGYCPYNTTFEKVASILREADLAIGNLESPLINSDIRHDAQLQFSPLLSADPDSIQALTFAGIDIVGLANNHYNDYGSRPVDYSVDILNKIGIKSFGYTYGRKEDNKPQTPLIVEVNGIKIGFLGYCSSYRSNLDPDGHVYFHCIKKRGTLEAGPAIYSDDAATRDVNYLKGKVDVIVVLMHWGIEYMTDPTKRQERQANHLQSLGVQIIIGAHPHVLEGHFINRSYLISYSLGNFLFGPKDKNQEFYCNKDPSKEVIEKFESYMRSDLALADPTTHSRILRIEINKKGVLSAAYVPIRIQLDSTTKCLQPTPIDNGEWITVCSPNDKACLKKN